MTLKVRIFSICLLCFTGVSATFGQEAYGGKGENRINAAWAYYGRGNGLSLLYDHGFSDLISAGAGVEVYVMEGERETSIFGLVDFHLQKALDLPEQFDLYPGAEIGFFSGDLDAYPYLGISWALSEAFGIYTEVGRRGTLGVYFNF